MTFALADYQQAEELDPHNEAIWARLAVVYNTLGLQIQKDRSLTLLKCFRGENENILVKSLGVYEHCISFLPIESIRKRLRSSH